MKKIILLVAVCSLLVTATGCDAFVRKFTRKPKQENLPREEMVLAPEEYKGTGMSKEELYRQYFLFWKSWQEELINSLSRRDSNHKKQLECVSEAINNLNNLRGMLTAEKQKQLDFYIKEMSDLKESIATDLYNSSFAANALSAERLNMDILRDFSYDKVKNNLL